MYRRQCRTTARLTRHVRLYIRFLVNLSTVFGKVNQSVLQFEILAMTWVRQKVDCKPAYATSIATVTQGRPLLYMSETFIVLNLRRFSIQKKKLSLNICSSTQYCTAAFLWRFQERINVSSIPFVQMKISHGITPQLVTMVTDLSPLTSSIFWSC